MKAWIENNVIRDVAQGNPADTYHPTIASLYNTDVPDEAVNGDGWVDGELVKPQPPEPVVIPEPVVQPVAVTVSPIEFKLLFTWQERIAIKTARATDPVIDDFYDIVEDPRLTHVNLSLNSTQQAIGYLATKELIAPERVAQILSGVVQ